MLSKSHQPCCYSNLHFDLGRDSQPRVSMRFPCLRGGGLFLNPTCSVHVEPCAVPGLISLAHLSACSLHIFGRAGSLAHRPSALPALLPPTSRSPLAHRTGLSAAPVLFPVSTLSLLGWAPLRRAGSRLSSGPCRQIPWALHHGLPCTSIRHTNANFDHSVEA